MGKTVIGRAIALSVARMTGTGAAKADLPRRHLAWAAGVLATTALLHIGCAGKRSHILSWSAYSQLDVRWPFVVRIERQGGGALLYFGAAHSSDPSDTQFDQIERLWAEFRAHISFNEGGNPPTENERSAAIRKYGEPGLIRYLAARDNVPVHSLDPSRPVEARVLIEQFGAQHAKLFYLLRGAAQYGSFDTERTIEEEIVRWLGYYGRIPGLEGPPRSIEELQAALDKVVPGSRPEATDPSWFDPVQSHNVLNDISRFLSEYRDRFMVDLLTREVLEGKKVFAVVGGSHVVMQEPALRHALR